MRGRLNPEHVKIKKNLIWDVLEIDLVRHQYNTERQRNRFTQFGDNTL